jgi:hypothetical protein
MIYEFRGPGAPKDIPAHQVGAELTRIYERDGGITPATVVDEARPPMALLHDAFEWDDSVAAERYREAQARQIVRSVVLVSEPEKRESAPIVRAFVSLSAPKPGAAQARIYKPTLDALNDPAEADDVKRRLRHELLALRRRYMDLLDVSDMIQAVHEVMAVA